MKPLLLLLASVLLAACTVETEQVVHSTWPNGEPKEIRVTEKDVPGVEIQQYHANGRLHLRGRLVNGQKQGTWNTYREDGLPWSQVDHVNGVKQGPFRAWHTSGMPHIEGQHHQGKPSGSWDFFSAEGTWLESKDFDAVE